MSVEFKTGPDGQRLAVLPEADYLALLDAAEDAADLAAVHRFRERLAAGEEERLPAGMASRLVAGESPVRVWREHRRLSLRELARQAGLSAPYLSEIETGKKEGGLASMKRLAEALGVEIDDLV